MGRHTLTDKHREYRRKRVCYWIELQGVVYSHDSVQADKLAQLMRLIAPIIPDEFWCAIDLGLSAYFVYKMADQSPEMQESHCDGTCWRDVTTDIGNLYAIGIAHEALEKGDGYGVLCILHELTHILEWDDGHGARFYERLGDMVSRVREQTGLKIENYAYGGF